MTDSAADPLALYVHWPFCRSKCPYCDFNSHVTDGIDHGRWRAALLAELDHAAAASAGRPLGSIFFGGGTPSLMAPETAAALIERAKDHWRAAPDIEITLEANPTSAEAARFAAIREAGINRLSLGIQALDDDALRFLGREHDAAQALGALGLATAQFGRVSFDLIYARPGQGIAAWKAELARALALAGDHLSLYQLTIEKGTAFFAAVRDGEFAVPGEDAGAALYDITQEMLEAAGLPAYEVSNHARAGAQCRHNLAVWRYGDYAGIGPGAHGRMGACATRRTQRPEDWLTRVESTGHGLIEDRALDAGERAGEAVLMGLRLTEGLDAAAFARRTGMALGDAIDQGALARLCEGGFIEQDERGVRATPAGRRVLNAVIAALVI